MGRDGIITKLILLSLQNESETSEKDVLIITKLILLSLQNPPPKKVRE